MGMRGCRAAVQGLTPLATSGRPSGALGTDSLLARPDDGRGLVTTRASPRLWLCTRVRDGIATGVTGLIEARGIGPLSPRRTGMFARRAAGFPRRSAMIRCWKRVRDLVGRLVFCLIVLATMGIDRISQGGSVLAQM